MIKNPVQYKSVSTLTYWTSNMYVNDVSHYSHNRKKMHYFNNYSNHHFQTLHHYQLKDHYTLSLQLLLSFLSSIHHNLNDDHHLYLSRSSSPSLSSSSSLTSSSPIANPGEVVCVHQQKMNISLWYANHLIIPFFISFQLSWVQTLLHLSFIFNSLVVKSVGMFSWKALEKYNAGPI